ncbi:hypothetical protein GSB9_01619 [Flavobacteriaceae bacterium GSB9]|nr:hypothetical protein GSB9_01619 [Flavobacteriaceae bacterium GSB9]
MKQLLILFFGVLFLVSCTDNKKKEQEKIEKAIQKIDSLETVVKNGIESLEKTTTEVEEQLKKLDTI